MIMYIYGNFIGSLRGKYAIRGEVSITAPVARHCVMGIVHLQ